MDTRVYQSSEIDQLFSEKKNLKHVISDIEQELFLLGRVLCEIKLNGMSLTPEDEQRFQDTGRREVEIIEVKSESVQRLLRESRVSLKAYLNRIREVAIKAAEALRLGVVQDANEMIGAIVDGSGWVTEMLNQIRSLDPHFMEVEEGWLEVERNFLKASQELLTAYQVGDVVSIADTLEYEWSNSIEGWLEILSSLETLDV